MSEFANALLKFKIAVTQAYGDNDGIIKIKLHPKLYNNVMVELAQQGYRYAPADFSKPQIVGVEIVPGVKDEF